MTNPYGSSQSRITRAEWENLNRLFQQIQPPAQNELYASGDHYILYMNLARLGFRPPGDAMAVYQMEEQILAMGYQDE